MIIYTEDEIIDLFSNLEIYRIFREKGAFKQIYITDFKEFIQCSSYIDETYAYMHVKGHTTFLKIVLLFKILNETLSETKLFGLREQLRMTMVPKEIIKEIYHIIKRYPIDQMPLNLNSFPEISSWRLRVGKTD